MVEVLKGRVKTSASLDNVNLDSEGDVQVDVKSMPPVSVEVAEKGFADAANVPARALVDADRHVQTDVLSMPPVSVTVAEKGFSNAADTPTRALVDADRHVQVDVLSGNVNIGNFPTDYAKDATLSSVLARYARNQYYDSATASWKDVADNFPVKLNVDNVGLAKDATLSSELTRKVKGDQGLIKQVSATDLRLDVYASYVANPSNLDVALSSRASESTLSGVKAQTDKFQFDVNNYLKTVPQATPNPSNLDVALSTRASESTLNAIKNALASVATDKVRVSPVDPIPREGAVTHFSVALTAAGATTIYTPSAGKAARVLGWSFYSNADVVVELRFGTSGNVIAGLPAKGAHAMNLIGLTAPQGAVNETIVIYGSGAVNVKGWICVMEV